MNEPRRVPEVPSYPFPEEALGVRRSSGDWFGPVMIGVAVLVVLAVGFGMVLAVFPNLVEDEKEGGKEGSDSSATTALTESLEADYGEEDWYGLIDDVAVEDNEIVVQTSAPDDTAEGLDAMCEAVLDAAGDDVEDATVSVVSDSGDELVTCPE